MPLATVHIDIAPLYESSSQESRQIDELFYGASVQILDQPTPGWCYIRTSYATEGFTSLACLNTDIETASAWKNYKKQVVLAPYIDILADEKPNAPRITSLPRGGTLVPLGRPHGSWQKVGLPSGKKGFTYSSYLANIISDWSHLEEEEMRWNVVETALSYNGSAYRVGGRSTLGIDSAGLIFMSYFLNGVNIGQNETFSASGLMRRIRFESMEEGDVLYFSASAGIYIGENRFVHANLHPGSEGVVVSSLNLKDPDYREDLAENIQAVASLY